MRFDYVDASDRSTSRTVRPVCMTFWGKTWLATAWCELRVDFRSFRPDRMGAVELLDATFEDEEDKNLEAFMRRVREEEESVEPGAVATATETVEIALTLDREIDSLSEEDQDRLLKAIGSIVEIGRLTIKRKEP